ncbi:hypothetical protein BCR41DRAFT_288640, partial [Lobosporangium transversale]
IYGDSTMFGLTIIAQFNEWPSMSEHEKHYNSVMNSQRTDIEWRFAKITQQFSSLDFVRTQRLLNFPIGLQYRVGTILCNIYTCFYGPTTSDFFGAIPLMVEEYLN